MNFNSTKSKALLSIAGLLFLAAGILTAGSAITTRQNINEKASASTNLYFAPRNQELNNGDNLSTSVAMDTGSNNVTGVDILLKFDPSILEITSIEGGSGITSFDNVIVNNFNNTGGTIGYTAFSLNKNNAVKGSGIEVLKISAKVKDNAVPGAYLISFDSTSAVSATNESQNALAEASTGSITVLNPVVNPTDSPTNAPGNPNSCGGTCGSNNNCESGLFCYQGYCRNPSCQTSVNCNCANPTNAPTPHPTNKITYAKTPIATSMPANNMVVVDLPHDPSPTITSFWQNVYSNNGPEQVVESPTIEPIAVPESKTDNLLPWIIGSFIAVGITLVLIALGFYKYSHFKKSNPPVIKL